MFGAVLEVATRASDTIRGAARAGAGPLLTTGAAADVPASHQLETGATGVARVSNNDYCELVALGSSSNNLSSPTATPLYTRNGHVVELDAQLLNANGHCAHANGETSAPPAIRVISPEADADDEAAAAPNAEPEAERANGNGAVRFGLDGSSENTSVAGTEEFASCADESPAHAPAPSAVIIDTHSAAASTTALIDLNGAAAGSQCAVWRAGVETDALDEDASRTASAASIEGGESIGNGHPHRHPHQSLARVPSMPQPEPESSVKIASEVVLPFLLAGLGMVAAGVLLDLYTVLNTSICFVLF